MTTPIRSLRLIGRTDFTKLTGSRGEIFYDSVNNTLRVFNSQTAGGEIIASRAWVTAQLPSTAGLATETYVDQAIATVPVIPEYLLKITADDSTVLAVGRDETLQIRGTGGVTTSIGTDSTGIQLIVNGFSGSYIDLTDKPGIATAQTAGFVKPGIGLAIAEDGTLNVSGSIALEVIDGLTFSRGVTVSEFSTDSAFTDNANDTVPTEAAVRGYIDRRLGLTHTGEVVPQLSKIGPKYLTNSEFFVLLQTSSSSINADEDRTIDALQFSLSAYTASFTATRTLRISNLIQGRMVTVYVRNTNGSSRTINVEASDSEEDFASVNMSRGAGQTSVTSITLAATSGTAVITVFGANGEICGFVN
jgi:hypothetical protein